MSTPATTTSEDIDADHLRTTLQALAARLGKTPTVVDLHDDPETDIHPEQYIAEYGDWESALDAAGLDPKEMGSKQIPDRELLAELQCLDERLDHPPRRADMKQEGEYSDTVYQNRFGSWNAALEHAMLDTQSISDDELKRELQRLADDLGQVPRAEDMDSHGEYSAVTYHRRFGSWLDALGEAGLLR